MDGKKTYIIEINGIEESISQVDALIAKLGALDAKISSLSAMTVNVDANINTNTNVETSSTPTPVEISAEGYDYATQAAAIKEINKLKNETITLEGKIAATQDEVYQKMLSEKALLKETKKDQEALVAQERLAANEYNNTMQGLKDKLKDLKSIINTTDLSDTVKIDGLSKEADEIANKLKEMEAAYGTFSRDVGHYEKAAEGFKGLAIQVGDTTQQFDNAKQAMKELQKEMQTLSTKKDMGLISPEEEERLKNLIPVVAQLRSSIQDAGKPMDAIMDTMQSIVAIAQAGKGISAFFGVDSDEIDRSIQKLVGLQNAMQGLQTIQKQLQTQEGIGGWIAKANSAIDAFAAKITGAKVAQDGLNASTTAGATASKTLTTAQNAQAVATTKATTATKALSVALKGLGIGLVVAAIYAAISAWDNLTKKEEDAKKATEDSTKAYADAQGELSSLQSRLDSFNGTKEQEKRIVDELNSKYGKSLGQYQSLAEWKKVLKTRGEAYCKVLAKEAEVQALLNMYTENFIKLQDAKKIQAEGGTWYNKILDSIKAPFSDDFTAQIKADEAVAEIENAGQEILDKVKEINKDIDEINKENNIGNYAPSIKKNTTKTKNAIEDANKIITDLELRLMKDGLTKKLKQLDEEERQTINKLKQNGSKTSAQIKQIESSYAKLRIQEINDYLNKVEETIASKSKEISKIRFQIDVKDIDLQIEELQNKVDRIGHNQSIKNTLITSVETKDLTKGFDKTKFDSAKMYENLFNEASITDKGDKFYNFLMSYLKQKNEDVQKGVLDVYNKTIGTEEEKQKAMFEKLESMFESEYSNELLIIRNYTQDAEQTLSQSFAKRIQGEKEYENAILKVQMQAVNEQGKLTEKRLEMERNALLEEEKDRYDAEYKRQIDDRNKLALTIKNFKARNDEEKRALAKLKEDLKALDEQILEDEIAFSEKSEQINREYNNKIQKNTTETVIKRNQIQEQYYSGQISNLRDMNSKINTEISKQPTYDSLGFGVINLSATKRSLKEIQSATITTLNAISEAKKKLNDDWRNGLITPEAYNATVSQLNDLESDVKGSLTKVGDDLKQLPVDFYSGINEYVQMVGQAANSILSSLSEITSNQYESLIDEQEKYIDKLQEMYDKQKEITQKYADDVNSIEDELKTARGDRRQQLIDNLNAEMAAQRASLAQEKKIEKEQEKAEEKKKKLEHDQAVAKKKMDLAQAVINMAMAISMAAVNKYPIPAIPMMALAASAAAAQIAAIKSQPIPEYGTGGIIQGKSHSQGGVKALVGNSPIELEGQEYVIRKKSTVSNVQVLDFINRSERKLNINDFIDFYSSGKVKKHILSASPKARYADGGQVIPTLRTDIEINDRLVQAMEDYSNRPVWVAVTEIEDAQANVRNVRVLSGLNNE